MKYPWPHLKFWSSGEWQALKERLDALEQKGIAFNPERRSLFKSLDLVPLASVRVAIIGQDPYPDPRYCTGVAFSIPETETTFPSSLVQIFNEYSHDLHYPIPTNGSLVPWANRGVLLFNSIPTCFAGQPGSHRDWTEWEYLTKELVEELSTKEIVICFVGSIAGNFIKYVPANSPCKTMRVSHPSPRASKKAFNPFIESRIFTTINSLLSEMGQDRIDWRLD